MKVNWEEFPFLEEKNHIISFVGAGGKTTLMYALAKEFVKRGIRVLITTTTHIHRPEDRLWAKSPEEVRKLWKEDSYAVVGQACENRKLKAFPENELQAYMQMAEVTLIEADGAKGMPCKVPASYEPVIPEECDIVIGVMGMDAPGNPVERVCFRAEEAERYFSLMPEEMLTEERAAEILASEHGTRKNVGEREYYVVLNKCDNDERIQKGERILQLLEKQGITKVLLTSFSCGEGER